MADDEAAGLELVAERHDVAGETDGTVAELVFVDHGARTDAGCVPS